MTGERNGTKNGENSTSPGHRFRFPPVLWWGYSAGLALIAGVNATSYRMEAERLGATLPLAPVLIDEGTSVLVILVLTPPLLAWARYLDPTRTGVLRAGIGHALGALAFGVAHLGGMVLSRMALHPLIGGSYAPGPFVDRLLYEIRKDVLAYAGLVILAHLLDRWRRKSDTAPPAPPPRFEVRDGAHRAWLDPAAVLTVEAAGNYVELKTADRAWLLRRTLADVEAELAPHGFLRIHRSRLVNASHVREVVGRESGDFAVVLANGQELAGSRRYREVIAAVAARHKGVTA
ncbi:MAG: LytTR family transcriptional regulator [Alphaproteobacteria bacterium]|nr:LytTR family transcriptional regulator [Alphaproteobacteria bacterium]